MLLTLPARAQVPDTASVDLEVEAVLEDLESETGDPEQLAELLADLADHPLDINTATAEALAQIPAFGPLLARDIVVFREAFGAFNSIPELRAVEGVTEDVYLSARPYLTIGTTVVAPRETPSLYPSFPSLAALRADLRVEAIQRFTRRLDLGRGYDDDTTRTTYLGSPERLYTRLNARVRNHLSLNLTLEKDPGEAFEWAPDRQTYGYDHVTAHAAIHNAGRLQTLIVGDYVANFGQGLVLSRSSAFGKGREPVRPLVRFSRGLTPYGSTDENAFFRGLAATVRLTPDLSLSAFASRRTLDANLLLPDTTEGAAFEDLSEASSLSLSGLHRTAAELGDKDALREGLVGGAVEYTHRTARVGITGYHSTFDRPFRPGDAAYQRFLFSGTTATVISGYGSVFLGDAHLFGEVARAPDGVIGAVGGAMIRLGTEAEALLLGRHYPRDFVSLHGHGFGERNGATQNESGLYVGLRLRPRPQWHLAAYFDQYRFPWARFGVPRPSTGHDALLLVEHRPHRWLSAYVQLRSETKEGGVRRTDARGRILDALRPETRQSLRLHGDYAFSQRLRLRARAEGVRFTVPEEPDAYGVILFQEVRWLPRPPLQLDLRLALFDTDTFDARVYAYENDLLYTFSVPAFSGRGQRLYILGRWLPIPRLTVQAKYAVTRYENVQEVGSGLDEVEGNRLRELRLQIRYRM